MALCSLQRPTNMPSYNANPFVASDPVLYVLLIWKIQPPSVRSDPVDNVELSRGCTVQRSTAWFGASLFWATKASQRQVLLVSRAIKCNPYTFVYFLRGQSEQISLLFEFGV